MHRDALGLIFAQQKEEKKNSKFSFCLSLALSVTLEKSIDLFMCKFLDPKVGNKVLALPSRMKTLWDTPGALMHVGYLNVRSSEPLDSQGY